MRRKILIGLAIAGFCLGVIVSRAVWEGRDALAQGDEAATKGDYPEAIAHWRRAARWYVPLAPHVGGAYDRLERLAGQAEDNGDIAIALSAWRGVRGSILATRSFFTPQSDRLEPANRAIARLMATQEMAAGGGDRSAEAWRDWHYQLLVRDEAPSVGWSIVALLGFALWIGGAFGFALRGLTEDDRLAVRRAAIAGGCVAAGLVIWLLGLYNA
jgi:hypothetical protein